MDTTKTNLSFPTLPTSPLNNASVSNGVGGSTSPLAPSPTPTSPTPVIPVIPPTQFGIGTIGQNPNSLVLPTTPIIPKTTTITPETATPVQGLSLPQQQTSPSPLVGALNTTPIKTPIGYDPTTLAPIPPTTPTASDTARTQYQALIDKYAGKPAETTALNATYGLDAKTQDATDAYNAYNRAKVASDQQIAAIYQKPGMTTDGINAEVAATSRVNNANLANLAVIAQAASGNLSAAQAIIKSKLDAEFQPITDQIGYLGNFIQLNNANLTDSQKTQLENTRFQLQNNLDTLRTAKTNAHQFALTQGITNPSTLNAIDQATTPAEAYQAVGGTSGGLPQNSNNQIQATVSPSNQQYIDHSSDGVAYVDQGRLQNMTPYQKQVASQEYAAAGIRVLDPQDVSALTTIDEAKQNLSLFKTTADNLLSSGFFGRIKGFTSNQLSQLTQNNPEWRQFQTLRAGLIKSVQGVAAGAPGLRVTGAELSNAADALPNSFDNKESSQQAINTFSQLLDVNRNVLLRGSAPKGSTQGATVQTKAGAVNVNW